MGFLRSAARLYFVLLYVGGPYASLRFYRDLLGLRELFRDASVTMLAAGVASSGWQST